MSDRPLTAADIPFASHLDRPSLRTEPLTPAELRLVSDVYEVLAAEGPSALDYASRWIVDLLYHNLQIRDLFHAAMEASHAPRTHRR